MEGMGYEAGRGKIMQLARKWQQPKGAGEATAIVSDFLCLCFMFFCVFVFVHLCRVSPVPLCLTICAFDHLGTTVDSRPFAPISVRKISN